MQVTSMETFALKGGDDSTVQWAAPDGKVYSLDPAKAEPGKWLLVNDTQGKPVMGLLTQPGKDGLLILSMEGAKSLAATLLHDEDDTPRQYYFATDGGNTDNPLKRWAFKLSAVGVKGSPVWRNAVFKILCVS